MCTPSDACFACKERCWMRAAVPPLVAFADNNGHWWMVRRAVNLTEERLLEVNEECIEETSYTNTILVGWWKWNLRCCWKGKTREKRMNERKKEERRIQNFKKDEGIFSETKWGAWMKNQHTHHSSCLGAQTTCHSTHSYRCTHATSSHIPPLIGHCRLLSVEKELLGEVYAKTYTKTS